LVTLRLLLLRVGQGRTFRRADGLIILTRYAHDAIRAKVAIDGNVAVVPHGVEDRFRRAPRRQLPLEEYSLDRPFRLLYVSIVDAYKHQWHVAEAVSRLRARGIPVVIDFVGPAAPPWIDRLREALAKFDPAGVFLRYHGAVPFDESHHLHEKADAFVFASSCENMPNILLESMAAGFPIACSNRGPMPEILEDGGTYFDPENPAEIAEAIRGLIVDPELRERCARTAFERASRYSWERCADETFEFIQEVRRSHDGEAS
jgi:glycosyltransferase involved in cell wall biosynthesis